MQTTAPHSRQITTPTPHQSIFTGWMLFLTPNQQCQSTEEYQLPEKLETGSLIAVGEMSQNFTMPGE